MKNVEKKELLEILDEIIENDCQSDLLQLVSNEIVDERMCQSEHEEVRKELARNGYFIDILIYDEFVSLYAYEWLINNNKLKQKHIDLAIKQDDNMGLLLFIRNEVVDERMCQSKDIFVRKELARNGYFVDMLIKEEEEYIRYHAYKWLINNNKLKQKHIDLAIKQDDNMILLLFVRNEVVDERMCQSKHSEIREELVKNGYFVDILIKDEDKNVKCGAYQWLIKNNKLKQYHIDLAIQEDNVSILLLLIEEAIVDKRMCQSNHSEIREELVKNGYFVDILIKDEDKNVKCGAYQWLIQNNNLKQHHIELAIQEDNVTILLLLIEEAIVDKRMCQSEGWIVRKRLAKKGYFVGDLINDKNEAIRCQAYKWLIENNKLEQRHIDILIIDNKYQILKKIKEILLEFIEEQNNIKLVKLLKQIQNFEEITKNKISLLINNKNILKNNS